MKAISLHEPYASIIAAGAKTIETRTWAPPANLTGQRIAIHAAQTHDTCRDIINYQAGRIGSFKLRTINGQPHMIRLRSKQDPLRHAEHWKPLNFGNIVATTRIGRCLPIVTDTHEHDGIHRLFYFQRTAEHPFELWRTAENGPPTNITHQIPYGHYQHGNFGWELHDTEPTQPTPARGQQGLWQWDGNQQHLARRS